MVGKPQNDVHRKQSRFIVSNNFVLSCLHFFQCHCNNTLREGVCPSSSVVLVQLTTTEYNGPQAGRNL